MTAKEARLLLRTDEESKRRLRHLAARWDCSLNSALERAVHVAADLEKIPKHPPRPRIADSASA